MHVERLPHLFREIVEIALVLLRQNHRGDPRPHGAEHFFLDAADRQNAATQRDLTRHRDVVARRPARKRRDERGRHRHTGGRSVLRNRSSWDVDVNVRVDERAFRNPQQIGVRLGVRQRRTGGLLHDVAQLTGQDQLALAAHDAGFDEHDVAADGRVIHPCRHADLIRAGHPLGMHLRPPDEIGDVLRSDGHLLSRPVRDLASDLAAELPDFALELADTRLASVAGDDLAQRAIGERQLTRAQTILSQLAGNEVPLGDLELLALGVAGEVDGLQPIEQRSGDALQEVRGRNEQDLGEVERDPQVVISERVVLRRVQHLQQRRGRISLEGNAQLVDFVEEEDRVLGARLLHPLEDAAGHRPDIGAPVAANVGLVPGAAERNPDVRPAHRPRDGFGDRGLPDARRSHEQQGRRARGAIIFVPRGLLLRLLLPQLADREELEHLVLHILEAVVIFLEDLRGLLQVERLFGALVPRQLGDGLEVGANDLRLHRFPPGALQPPELAIDLFARRLRQLQRIEPLLEIVGLRRLFLFTQLLANRLHLLAQQHLALAFAQLFLDLRLDVFLRIDDGDLALHVHQHATQPILHRERLQQLLALQRLDVEMAGDEIGEGAGVADPLQHLLDDFCGQSRLLAQFRGPLADLAMQRYERGILLIEWREILRFTYGRFEITVGLAVVDGGPAGFPVEDQLHATQIALHLTDSRDRSGVVQHDGGDLIDIFLLRYRKDFAVGVLEGGFYGAQCRRTAD